MVVELLMVLVVGEWREEAPVQQVSGYNQTINDLRSHLTPAEEADCVRRCPGTLSHYLSHWANWHVQRKYKHAVYCLDNRTYVFTPPTCKLSDVARLVSQQSRGENYNTYLVNYQRWHEDNPYIIADEALAYLARLRSNREKGLASQHDYTMVRNFVGYLGCLARLEPIDDFYGWYVDEALAEEKRSSKGSGR